MAFGNKNKNAEEASEEVVAAEVVLDASVTRALTAIIKTVDMFKDTALDVLDAGSNSDISLAELKDLVSRCKSYSLIVEKEFKIMRRRMASK